MAERVKIVGDHPHRGSTGTVVPEKAMSAYSLVGPMEYVSLDDSRLADACYVDRSQLRPLPKEEDPRG